MGASPRGKKGSLSSVNASCHICARWIQVETWLVNARDVKHLPGRPKTDTLDAVWLCKVAERQMLRPSFVPHDGSGSCGR